MQKLIRLTIINWGVQNWLKWSSNSGSGWQTWSLGYSLKSGIWFPTVNSSSQNTSNSNNSYDSISSLSNSFGITTQILVSISVGVTTFLNLMNLSSMSSFWSMINQLQLYLLLLLTGAFIPSSIVSLITDSKFASFPFDYFSFESLGFYSIGISEIDYELRSSNLTSFGLKSSWTLYNLYSFIIFMILIFLAHFLLYLFNKYAFWWKENSRCSCIIKKWKLIVNKLILILTYGYYIRAILEVNQYTLTSSISEIKLFDSSSTPKIISLIFAFLCLIFSLIFIAFVSYLSFSSYEINDKEHNKIGEFFEGVKKGKYKIYTLNLLLRRFIFVSVLIIFASKSSIVSIGTLYGLQIIYLVILTILRPFEEVKWNLIEILNEIYFIILFGWLLHFNTEEIWSYFYKATYIYLLASNGIIITTIIISNLFLNIL